MWRMQRKSLKAEKRKKQGVSMRLPFKLVEIPKQGLILFLGKSCGMCNQISLLTKAVHELNCTFVGNTGPCNSKTTGIWQVLVHFLMKIFYDLAKHGSLKHFRFCTDVNTCVGVDNNNNINNNSNNCSIKKCFISSSNESFQNMWGSTSTSRQKYRESPKNEWEW